MSAIENTSFGSKQASKPASFKAKLASLSSRSPEFDAVVAPLEAIADEQGWKPLNGPGLRWCLSAFGENPEGFAVCAARAYARWRDGESKQPLGLLCAMVRAGEHRRGWAVQVQSEAEEIEF